MNALTLTDVSVTYRRYAKPRDALWEWLTRRPRHQTFHALQHLHLQLAAGDSLGIIGDNGAGKSTLLKLLAGNLPPSTGQCEVIGQRSALLELGAGLQPEFSGIDNARMGLALRGLDTSAIAQKLPEVLDFAELGEFAHQPIKTYSSGMVVRLVFAIAVTLQPDVLIVDEALAVGDQYFQKKSLDRMRAILHQGATLVFCSHNLYQVREMCRLAVWLENGQIKQFGTAQSVVDAYQDAVRQRQAVSVQLNNTQPRVVQAVSPQLLDVVLNRTQLHTHDYFTVTVSAHCGNCLVSDVHIGIVVRRNDDVQCFGISTLHDHVPLQRQADGSVSAQLIFDDLPLLSGHYCLEVWLIDSSGVHVYDARERCAPFQVQQASQRQGVGMAWLPHRWCVTSRNTGV